MVQQSKGMLVLVMKKMAHLDDNVTFIAKDLIIGEFNTLWNVWMVHVTGNAGVLQYYTGIVVCNTVPSQTIAPNMVVQFNQGFLALMTVISVVMLHEK